MLPNKDGFEILKNLRKEKMETPVIMLTAKSEMADKLNGLENGADDYITKPFHMRELVARVKVILKRKTNIKDTNILEYCDLKLDLGTGKEKQKQFISDASHELKTPLAIIEANADVLENECRHKQMDSLYSK